MNILIIIGHPNTESFNHSIAKACIETILKNGHTFMFHDLYEENFNPVISKHELSDVNYQSDKTTAQYRKDLVDSDAIIIIHPNWWGQPPAIVKGWIDRILTQGVAYKFVGDKPKCLLKAKTAIIFNTSNTEKNIEDELFNNTLDVLWKKRIFNFVGINEVVRKNFSIVKESNDSEREEWLHEVNEIINDILTKQ